MISKSICVPDQTHFNVKDVKGYLSLRAVLVAHVGGGVLVDAVVGQVGEHISHLGALIAVLVGCKPKFQN